MRKIIIISVVLFLILYRNVFSSVDTRLVYVSNDLNTPSPGQGTLVIDVEAISSSGTPLIRVFQDAFRLDEVLRNQNPIVTFSEQIFTDDEVFPGYGPAYNVTEQYQLDGDVIYSYTLNSFPAVGIGTSWTRVLRVSIEYTMTGATTTISWSPDLPDYLVYDINIINITGVELPIPSQLNDLSLPIQLSTFTASIVQAGVELIWVTESEINNAGFEVWRSSEEDDEYTMISGYQYNQALQGQGNSNIRHKYTYLDELVVQGQTYWYKLVDVAMNGSRTEHGPVTASVLMDNNGLTSVSADIPKEFKLHQNYPNPFNPSTRLRFDIPQVKKGKEKVSLVVYNSLGQVVRSVYSGEIGPGSFEVVWDGRSEYGSPVPSGIYFAMFKSDSYRETRRLILLK